MGWENTLLIPGNVPTYIYSDMNGFGHFVPSILVTLLLVCDFCASGRHLHGLCPARSRGFAARAQPLARARIPALSPALAACALLAVGAGGWFYYNAHVLNDYTTAADRRHQLADYERQFKKYQNLDQPKVTAVDAAIDIYPAQRSFSGTGRFTLQNKSGHAISEIHITDQNASVSQVKFDRPFHLISSSARNLYSIYALDQPLQVGEVVTLTFAVSHISKGFRDGKERAEFAYNGSFFGQEFFPNIGYEPTIEIDDPRRRREEHLGALQEMPERGDPRASRINLFRMNSDWITYHTVVSTSDDQIAIAPGYLVRSWQKGGRRYYEYSMGSTHILDFFAYMSARYAVRKGTVCGHARPDQPGGLLRSRAYLQYRRDAGRIARRSRLLREEFQPISIQSIPNLGVSALPYIRPKPSPIPCLTRNRSASSAACLNRRTWISRFSSRCTSWATSGGDTS